ncbi:cell division protein ZipA C-terminal FtsZ-binding domain-containing protein [Caldimonas aquatica]|uniref:Cell division protein ZipA n=1 Tax=Caldimonas aquatica TaxID=376175 RepID=A0ABY6MMB5_9BURK|nr:cell division protein ZipA C-terminal FtsZ-binding domain-containing protein [Schlegelella aquatica]UZD53653.1 cell division protein FtsZ [Schlegelella aquatica]
MSSLQLALAVVGALVLVAMFAYNTWQTRRSGVRRPSPRPEPVAPVEPTLDGPAAPDEPERLEPVLDVPALVAAVPPRRPGPRLDPLVDAIATLPAESRLSGDSVLAHLPPTRRAGSKPFLIEGLNDATGEWEAPQHGHLYRELQAGVLMASRTGPLNEIEYSEFVQKVQAFADALGVAVDFPDMLEVVAQARELDQFASQHDAQLACRLQARGAAWSVAYIQQHAARHGFVPGVVPGRLVLPGSEEGAPPVLILQFDSQAVFADDPNAAAVRDVTLAFDVPQTPAAEQPFEAWQRSAEALAADMDAIVVDDAGRLLTAQAFAAIGAELDKLYQALEARGLPAGSAAARRLFS